MKQHEKAWVPARILQDGRAAGFKILTALVCFHPGAINKRQIRACLAQTVARADLAPGNMPIQCCECRLRSPGEQAQKMFPERHDNPTWLRTTKKAAKD